MKAVAPIKASMKSVWSIARRRFVFVLQCPAVPAIHGIYMGDSYADARVALARLNARREAIGFPAITVD